MNVSTNEALLKSLIHKTEPPPSKVEFVPTLIPPQSGGTGLKVGLFILVGLLGGLICLRLQKEPPSTTQLTS